MWQDRQLGGFLPLFMQVSVYSHQYDKWLNSCGPGILTLLHFFKELSTSYDKARNTLFADSKANLQIKVSAGSFYISGICFPETISSVLFDCKQLVHSFVKILNLAQACKALTLKQMERLMFNCNISNNRYMWSFYIVFPELKI